MQNTIQKPKAAEKIVTIRLSPDEYNRLKSIAHDQKRSMGMQALVYICDGLKLDEEEAAAIAALN